MGLWAWAGDIRLTAKVDGRACGGKPLHKEKALALALYSPGLRSMNLLFHIGRYFMLLGEVFSKPERLAIYWKRTVEEMDLLGVKSLGIVSLLSLFMGAVITIQTKTNIDSPLIPQYVVGFTARQSTILEFSPTIISLILAGKVGSTIAAEIGSMRVREQIDALDIMGVNSAGYLILPKIIATVSAYQGYYTSGGTREVGISSTKAVVYSDVVILIMNYLLTQMLLL